MLILLHNNGRTAELSNRKACTVRSFDSCVMRAWFNRLLSFWDRIAKIRRGKKFKNTGLAKMFAGRKKFLRGPHVRHLWFYGISWKVATQNTCKIVCNMLIFIQNTKSIQCGKRHIVTCTRIDKSSFKIICFIFIIGAIRAANSSE